MKGFIKVLTKFKDRLRPIRNDIMIPIAQFKYYYSLFTSEQKAGFKEEIFKSLDLFEKQVDIL